MAYTIDYLDTIPARIRRHQRNLRILYTALAVESVLLLIVTIALAS